VEIFSYNRDYPGSFIKFKFNRWREKVWRFDTEEEGEKVYHKILNQYAHEIVIEEK
jgi:hypothetical protein